MKTIIMIILLAISLVVSYGLCWLATYERMGHYEDKSNDKNQ